MQSNSVLMLAVALLLVGISLIFSPIADTRQGTVPAVGEPLAGLTAGAPANASDYTDRMITGMQARVRKDPSDYLAFTRLGIAYLQKARETNDPSFYGLAEDALHKALALSPNYYDALAAFGSLELSRHEFAKALEWGRKAQQAMPEKAYAYGVIGDALIELGRYGEAVDALQRMVDLRPDLSSYSRISYARELHGDIQGAIEAMQMAVQAGSPAAENTAWCRVQLGKLYFNTGQLDKAEQAFTEALQGYPGYMHALAGLGQVRWAQGNTDEAIRLYEQAVSKVPYPEYLMHLGDLYAGVGDTKSAQEQYDLVMYIFKVFESNKVDVSVEKAAFLADYNLDPDPQQAVALAESAIQKRQDVNTQDVLAWAYYRAGRYKDALAAEQQAMRLGTRNPMFYYHLGMIYDGLGDTEKARLNVQEALRINPHFSIRYSRQAQEFLRK
jgi:tetratricopeptide (TPR) repeat protein